MIGWRSARQTKHWFVMEHPETYRFSRSNAHTMINFLPAKLVEDMHYQIALAFPGATAGEHSIKLLQASCQRLPDAVIIISEYECFNIELIMPAPGSQGKQIACV